MKIVTVIPLKKGLWKEDLTYFTAKDIPNGSIVTIPLRNQKVLGLVVFVEEAVSVKSNIKGMSFNLKKISEVKEHSIFLKEYLESAIEISKYFVANKNNAITSLLPAIFREKYDQIVPAKTKISPSVKIKKGIRAERLILQASFEDRIASYKILIRGSFAQKKSVFIVLPTEHDIKIFEESLSRGIEQFVFTFHGGLNAKKVIKKFEQVTTLDHPVLVLGTAPFLSIPRDDISVIILEHESSNSYKMIAKPHIDLRVFAELFASKINAKFILSDTLLRFETLGRCDTKSGADGLVPMHPLSYRINFKGEIEIPNPKDRLLGNLQRRSFGFKILADESLNEIKNAIDKKKNVFIFSLRKGLATQTVCKDCGEMVSCEKCLAPVVLYYSGGSKKRMFVCNRCEREIDSDIKCISCGGWNLIPLGIGTDTVFEEVKKYFPQTKILKLDKESAKTKIGAEKIVKEFEENAGSILVGTEMTFSYLQNKVPLSIIASFDSLWSIPNFKMSERIIQIILFMIGNTTEKFIIQTKNENDGAILAIQSENLLSFVREELEDRKKLNYPPFKRFIKITYLGDKEQTTKTRKVLQEIFKEYNPEIFSGFVAKQKDKYVTNALIKIDPKKWSLPELSAGASIDENLLSKLLSLPPSFNVVVDPEDLL